MILQGGVFKSGDSGRHFPHYSEGLKRFCYVIDAFLPNCNIYRIPQALERVVREALPEFEMNLLLQL